MLWGLGAIVWGIYKIARSTSLFYKSRQSLGWPSTLGKIVSLEVVTKTVDRESTYEPRIRCEYMAKGVQCVSNISHMKFKEKFDSSGQAWRFLTKYSEGSSIPVYFNPNATEEIVLNPGTWEWVPLATGIGLVLLGAAFCYWRWIQFTTGLPHPSEQGE